MSAADLLLWILIWNLAVFFTEADVQITCRTKGKYTQTVLFNDMGTIECKPVKPPTRN